jgi:hypothetical protein
MNHYGRIEWHGRHEHVFELQLVSGRLHCMPAAFCTSRWTQHAERGGRTAAQGGQSGVCAVFQSSGHVAEGTATAVIVIPPAVDSAHILPTPRT